MLPIVSPTLLDEDGVRSQLNAPPPFQLPAFRPICRSSQGWRGIATLAGTTPKLSLPQSGKTEGVRLVAEKGSMSSTIDTDKSVEVPTLK